MQISKDAAERIVDEEAERALQSGLNTPWLKHIEQLSALCEEGKSKTHIAFFGTLALAKALSSGLDLYAIKPAHAADRSKAFSARTLCHEVLVPAAARHGFSIGVNGREPLNNQPYFRMNRLGDDTPIHAGGRAAFNYMLDLVKKLSAGTSEQARDALCAFIAVRKRYQRSYANVGETVDLSLAQLIAAIREFVASRSDGGKKAQAVVAGLLDTFAGAAFVESGRINDPSRNYPGDVCVRVAPGKSDIEKSFEVRDKPVSLNDAIIFGKKCADSGVRECAIVMSSSSQARLDEDALGKWSQEAAVRVTLFYGWEEFVQQVLFWASVPSREGVIAAAKYIRERLISVEASGDTVSEWDGFIGSGAEEL